MRRSHKRAGYVGELGGWGFRVFCFLNSSGANDSTAYKQHFFGDYLYNKAHYRRPHDGVLAAWADAMRAPANAPVVHGDKEKPEVTRQYNEGYKTDLAEPHAGPGGVR